MPQRRLGIALPTRALPLPRALDVVLAAEAFGFSEAWTDEVNVADAMTPLAWLSARSASLGLGVGVVPATTRPPALLALTAATLQRMSGGRLMLGIGASTPAVLRGWMGMARNATAATLSETIELLRLVTTGEVIDYPGETAQITGFRLAGGGVDLPLYVGAHGEKTLAVAGAMADGVVLGNVGATWIPRVLRAVHNGATAAGRSPDELDVVCRVVVGVGESADALEPQFRSTVASYTSSRAYREFFARMGFAAQMSESARAWADHDGAAAAAAIPDEMIAQLFIVGSPRECATRLAEFYHAGVNSLVIVPVSSATTSRAERMLEGLQALSVACGTQP